MSMVNQFPGRVSRADAFVSRMVHDWLAHHSAETHRRLAGSLLIADIVGFSRMVAQMEAAAVEAGAEDISLILELSFARLIGEAERKGGDLLFTGGDSLTILFTGPDHARRACEAARNMVAALRAVGPIPTDAGPITPAMSAGVATGEFDFVLTGEWQRQLCLAGGAALACAQLQRDAADGTVLLSPETVRLIPTSFAGAPAGSGCTLRLRGPRGRDALAEAPPTTGPLALQCIPPALRELAAEGVPGENRPVSVAFVRFNGVHEGFGIEEAGSAVAELVDLTAAILAAAREFDLCLLGTDFDLHGVLFILTAGVPRVSPSPTERVLWAARKISQHSLAPRLQLAVAAGRAYAGELGTSTRMVYSVIGHALNVADRLLDSAGPGDIVAEGSAIAEVLPRFDATALTPRVLRGHREAITPFRVNGVRAGSPRSLLPEAPFVGREYQVEMLRAAAASHQGMVIEVRGEAGIGKSRLLAETIQTVDADIFQVECLQYERSTPYACFRRLLRRVLNIPEGADPLEAGEQLASVGATHSRLAPWLPFIGLVVDARVPETAWSRDVDPSFRRTRLQETVLLLLESLLTGPTLLVFEDVHWIDDASGDLLRFLVSHAEGQQWIFILTIRDGEGDFRLPTSRIRVPVTSIWLAPLSEPESVELAEFAADQVPLPTDAVHSIAKRAAGNPLYILELVHASRDGGNTGGLPRGVENLTAAAIDRLPPIERQLVRAAAVLGDRFRLSELAEIVSPGDRERETIEGWLPPPDILQSIGPGEFRFRHSLLRDTAYLGLSKRRLRLLHQSAGEALEKRGGAIDRLALHFGRAGDGEKCWRYARQAAEAALAKDTYGPAVQYLEAAIAAAPRVPEVSRAEVLSAHEQLGDALERVGSYARARAAFARARELAKDDAVTKARLLRKSGDLYERAAAYPTALRLYARALRLLAPAGPESGVEEERGKACLAYAGARLRQGKDRDCWRWCERALALGELARSDRVRGHAYYLLQAAATNLGDPDAESYAVKALELLRSLGDSLMEARVLNNAGYLHAYVRGNWGTGLESYRASLELRQKVGDNVGAAMVTNNIAEILSDQGRYEEAGRLFREALRAVSAAAYPLGVAFTKSNLGRLHVRQGRLAEGLAFLLDARSELHRMKAATRWTLETEARIAEYHLAAGEPQRALDLTGELRAAIAAGSHFPGAEAAVFRVEGLALKLLDRAGEAEDRFRQSVLSASREGLPFEEAQSLQALANLGARSDGAAAAAQAIFARLGVERAPGLDLVVRALE